ncbi:uncharacterized protein LOC106753060 [Vigna radiata var. radiata]|uniref:Uncharacterized protein LOC106753060 n=1 Tax=Vigna radiata var. radiata TaxID=3916 RepID=A0A1S3T993_VIGRR|nr:uncharacterized protein LOC106753060 [Vigna radiata var. radiata]
MVEGVCEEEGEVAGNEGDKITENVVDGEERVQADDVVEGHIETEVVVGEVEEDAVDVRSWTSSGEDDAGNDEVNYECMDGLVDVNVQCDLEEDVGDGVADWFGNVQVEVQYDDSDLDDGISSDLDRGLSDEEWKSDELDSGAKSDGQDDEEEAYGKFETFSMPKTMLDYKWDRKSKAIASDHVDGSFKDQYRRIYDYANELVARNPGSTVKVKVEEIVDGHIFKRFYTCLKAGKDSFVSYRPIIGLDGAFLKGKYGGEMLTAVGRDANDQMLPLAYAVVEVENKESWRWFLELLVEDLGGIKFASSFTIMSDQQKGLLQAIQEVIPRVDQRFCVRHLYANFRKQFPGKQLKRLMWKAATTTLPQTLEAEMRNIKQLNDDAFKYLFKIPPRHWSRSRFISKPQCDTLVNNMSEAFNSVMLHTRSKPIVCMLEDIRLYLMKRWATNRTKSQSLSGEICPKIKTRLNKESQLTKYWIPCWKWEITAIPCCHSLVAMKFVNLDAEDFIPCCFRKSTYEEIYSSIIYPINGNNMWDITTYVDVLPPPKRVLPGRPKKKRRLQQWELVKDDKRMRKGGLKKRCGICKDLGHNRKSCTKGKQAPDLNCQQPIQTNSSNLDEAVAQGNE